MRGIHIFRIILVRKTLDFKGFSCLILFVGLISRYLVVIGRDDDIMEIES